MVSLGGVIQEAGSAFTLNNDEITFSNPPTADANIFIIALGNSVSIGVPADNTVTQRQLSDNLGEYSGIGTIILSGIVSATSIKIGSAITFSQSGIDVTGVVTATTFKGDGSNLTGITNATTVTVADESSDTTCFPIFATAATGDLAPKSGTNLTFNSSSGALTATSFAGDGSALTGVASTDNIRTNTNSTFLQNINVSGSTTTGSLVSSGAISGTTGTFSGAISATTGTFTSHVALGDDDELQLGDSDDLRIYHNGSHSYISNVGTGELVIEAKSGENGAVFRTDGAAELYYDGTKRLETTSTGVTITGGHTGTIIAGDFTLDNQSQAGRDVVFDQSADRFQFKDNLRASFGDDHDLMIYHDSNQSYIYENGTGDLNLQTNGTKIKLGKDNGATCGAFIPDGAVELYHNNTKRFETTSTGVTVTGAINPAANNTYDLGTTSLRWRNIYTNDLNLSNEGGANDVDGTWGSYTIQEGAEDLFLINRRNGKKYKFNLTEVS